MGAPSRPSRRALTAVLAAVGVGLVFLVQLRLGTGEFDRLERDQVAADAQRVGIALDYETRVLSNYGATNSIWDDSFAAVGNGDEDLFKASFPTDDVTGTIGIDGVVGVARDGTPRVGGLAGDGSYALPAGLDRAAALGPLFDPAAAPGSGRCGAVTVAAGPFLFCGFATYPTSSEGEPSGGLIFLKSLQGERLADLSRHIGLPLTIVAGAASDQPAELNVATTLGQAPVRTRVDGDQVVLQLAVPTVDGTLVVEATHDRPMHAAATRVALQTFLLTVVTGLALAATFVVMRRRAIRQQVSPLRRTAEAVIASGDRHARVNSSDTGEIGALGRAIDTMLDALAAQDEAIEADRQALQEQLEISGQERRRGEEDARRRASEAIEEATAQILAELRAVVDQVAVVRQATTTIDEHVAATGDVVARAVERGQEGDRVTGALGESLRRVGGIAELIAGVAEQTNLLALNATIEAARAGTAGASFAVVAGEVKDLAMATSRSTRDIGDTIGSLEHDTAAMAESFSGMTASLEGVGGASAQLTTVTDAQRASVAELDRCVHEAIARIEALAAATGLDGPAV